MIRRTDPGPFENPQFLTLLSYQAACVESCLSELLGAGVREQLSKVLLGTIQKADVNASAHLSRRGYTIITVNAGLVDLIIESAKAVIEASNPARPADSRSATSHTSSLNEISDGLKLNTGPIERVWKTLEACFFDGYPRSTRNESIEEDHGSPFTILVSMALRWVIAHEYGHSLELDFSNITGKSGNHGEIRRPGAHNTEWAKEFFADTQATIITVHSAANLDGLPPEFSLSGGIFTLRYLDILQRTYAILTTGHAEDVSESSTHPPHRERAENTVDMFRQFFNVQYFEDSPSDVSLVLRDRQPERHSFSGERKKVPFLYANVLQKIQHYVEEMLKDQYMKKRPLHPMWR